VRSSWSEGGGHSQCQLSLLVLSCGGRGVADGEPDGPVAEISDEVQPAAEGLDVAGDDLEGGDLAVLDLGHPGDAHPHGGGDLLLAQGQLLAGLGELVPARLGEQLARADLDFLGGDPGGVQLTLQVLPVQGGALRHGGLFLCLRGVVQVQLLGDRDVLLVPPFPVPGLVAAEEQQR
jgi:hypothetical protein